MIVRDAMTELALVVGPDHSVREAASMMAERGSGAALVDDRDGQGIGIITERDVLLAIGGGLDPDVELVRNHRSGQLYVAGPDWPLLRAAEVMISHGFRHLVVVEHERPVGICSMRDIVRVVVADRQRAATS